MSKKSEFVVLFGYQGQQPKGYMVGSGATVKSVLVKAKINPDALGGSLTLNGQSASLADRVKTNDYIELTPKAAGGR